MPASTEYEIVPTSESAHTVEAFAEYAKSEPISEVEDLETLEKASSFFRSKRLLTQSFPVIFSFVVSMGTTFITQYFAGHFELEGSKSAVFAGIALAIMYYNVTCRSLLIGMTSAVDTLASQHNGARNYVEVGIVLQRCLAILTVFSIVLMPLWLWADTMFSWLRIEKQVCVVIGSFIRIRVLALPADIVNESYEKYLMAMGEMSIPMYTNLVISGAIISMNLYLVHFHEMGYESLAWAVVISEYIGALTQYGLSLKCESVQRTLQPWSWSMWRHWWGFISLAVPGLVMTCSEWWAFEILTIFASLISTEAVAAQAVMMQISTLAFMFPLGLSITVTCIIGNSLGARKRSLAIEMGKLSFLVMIFLEVFIALTIVLGGKAFVQAFSLDDEVRQTSYSMIPYLALFTVSDAMQGISSGILRGTGRQHFGALVNISTYYLVGLPLAWYLCFHTALGVRGLLLGIAGAVVLQTAIFLTLILGFEEYTYSLDLVHHCDHSEGKRVSTAIEMPSVHDASTIV